MSQRLGLRINVNIKDFITDGSLCQIEIQPPDIYMESKMAHNTYLTLIRSGKYHRIENIFEVFIGNHCLS